MRKITTTIAAILLLLCAGLTANAQDPACDPCYGQPWTYDTAIVPFTLPYRPGCSYVIQLVYGVRTCMGHPEVNIVSCVYVENPGTGCDLACSPDGPNLEAVLYNYLMSRLGPIIKAEPSSCFYLGKVTMTPAAQACFNEPPGSTCYVQMPCNDSGCCIAQLTPLGGNQYNQTVLLNLPCPARPTIPPSDSIKWACDRIGGGFTTFSVPFTPDSPLVCNDYCMNGTVIAPPRLANPESVTTLKTNVIMGYSIYPNPVKDQLNISFAVQNGTGDATVDIYNTLGQRMIHRTLNASPFVQTFGIDTHELASGVYTCRFQCGDNVKVNEFEK